MTNQNWYCDPDWWAIIVGFFTALFLGFIAIFRDWIISWLKKPKLKISISPESPYIHSVPFSRKTEGGEFFYDSYYFHFKIENRGNFQIESANVIVSELSQRNEEGQYDINRDFLPLNLIWSHIGVITMPIIYQKTHRYCDFGYIIKSEYASLTRFGITQTSEVIFQLATHVAPNTGSHILKPGDYRIKIVVSGKNIKTQTKTYNLIFRDAWTDDEEEMLTQNITIEEL